MIKMKCKKYTCKDGKLTAFFSFKPNIGGWNKEYNFNNREKVFEFIEAYSEENKSIKIKLINIIEVAL